MAKGWDRASLDLNTRPDKIVRDIAAVLFSAVLFVFSSWDFDRQRRWGREA